MRRAALLPLLSAIALLVSWQGTTPETAPRQDAPTTTAEASFAHGVRLFQAGDPVAALRAFRSAEQLAGDRASPELLCNVALTALEAGEVRIAERCAETMAARGGAEFYALRDFVLGNAAYLEGERAEAEAEFASADPTALGLAIQHVERARKSWTTALTTRGTWPEAARNIVRANRRLTILKLKRQAAEDAKKTKKAKQKKKGEKPPELEEREAKAQKSRKLSSDDLAALLAKIAANDEAKRKLRRQRRDRSQSDVARDW